MQRQKKISQVIVTAGQMRDIEDRIFAAGMPVVALMEKVAGLVARRIQEIPQFPVKRGCRQAVDLVLEFLSPWS